MYKILNSQGLGVAGKQNELIELALTHDFHGVEVDIVDLVGRHDALGKEFACQFLQSAKIDMGTFCLPALLGASEEDYQASIAKLDTIIDLATTLNCKRCYVQIQPTSSLQAFQDNFELHQSRLREIGARMEPQGIRIGVALQACDAKSAKGEFKFIQTAEEILTLAKTVGQANVGLCLDSWEWVVGGGTLAQLQDLDVNQTITELRLADVPADTDLETITKNDRTNLPGEEADAISFNLTKQLLAAGYEGSISAATSLSNFADGPRDKVVGSISRRLDQFIAGEDPAAIAAAEEAKAIEAESAADSEEESSAVAAGTSEN